MLMFFLLEMEHERLFGFVVSLVPEMEREKICQ
jgi:hypothetical protein